MEKRYGRTPLLQEDEEMFVPEESVVAGHVSMLLENNYTANTQLQPSSLRDPTTAKSSLDKGPIPGKLQTQSFSKSAFSRWNYYNNKEDDRLQTTSPISLG